MPTSYTSLLGLALPVTGELAGTWGDTVNNYITEYLDASIAGAQTISGSLTAVTLSKTTNASLSQAGSGATGSSQYQIINCTGNPASLLTITVPAASKVYLVINSTSTNQSVKVVGSGPTTGVTVSAARCALIAWDGTDFKLIASTDVAALQGLGTGVATALGINVGTAGSVVVNGGALGTPSSGTVTNLTGTASININGTVGATTPTTGAFTTLTTSSTVTHNGGTANGVAYLNGSKVLTTGSALTFDGANLAVTGNTRITGFTAINTTISDTAGLRIGQSADQTLGTNYAVLFSGVGYSGGIALNATSMQIGQNSGSRSLTFHSGTSFAERMRIDSSGNVGIGRTPTNQKLEVAGRMWVQDATQPTAYFGNTLADYVAVYYDPAAKIGYLSAEGASTQVVLRTNSTERMRIDNIGHVGIGTTSPSFRLSVKQSGNTSIASLGVASVNSANDTFIGMGYDATSDTNRIFASYISTGAHKPISFWTADAERMRIDSSGNVGIGTSSPTGPLDVNGIIKSRGVGGEGGQITLLNPTNTADGAVFDVDGSSNLRLFPAVSNASTLIGSLGTPGGTVQLFTAQTERMRIDSSGNVGIGTSSPTALLDVNTDTVRVRTAKTPASQTAAGNAGDICWDSNYIYVCVATNTWKRVAIAGWV